MVSAIPKSFVEELAKDEARLNLAHAALLISQHVGQLHDPAACLADLDQMAETVRPAVEAAPTPTQKIAALNSYFFDQLGFRGNTGNYYNPNNSFLNQVLEIKLGIPISLSVIYLEVGWRLGLPVWGIGMPGHFIAGWGAPDEAIYIDVFNQGRLLSEADCRALCNISESNYLAFKAQYLRPAPKKEILFRMLLNLKQIYIHQEDWPLAYSIVDLMLAVRPDQPQELKDRGLLAYRLDRLHAAILDLNRYLFLVPLSPDKDRLEAQLELMEEKLLQLN